MASKAIVQMMSDVHWGELDYLVVDLPPGTGDASLTIAQSVPLTGVVIAGWGVGKAGSDAGKAADLAQAAAVGGARNFEELRAEAIHQVE